MGENIKLKGMDFKSGSCDDEIKWQVVESKSVTVDEVGLYSYCGVMPEYGFYKAKLAEDFLLMWPKISGSSGPT